VETTSLNEHFASVKDIILIPQSGGLAQLSTHCERFPQCVVVVSAAFAEVQDAASILKFLREHPATCVLVFLEYPHEELVDALLVHGYHGVLTPQTSPANWEKMVRCVNGGEMWVQRAALTRVFRRLILYDACNLSRRESEILALLGEGLSNRAIAQRLFIAPDTIRWHLRQLYSKTGVGVRRKLLIYAKRYVEAKKLRDALNSREKVLSRDLPKHD
jgi:DNA-binding NarL/FixJ family response regulator